MPAHSEAMLDFYGHASSSEVLRGCLYSGEEDFPAWRGRSFAELLEAADPTEVSAEFGADAFPRFRFA